MGGMLWMMVGMGSRSDRASGSPNDPLEIVRQRYARGAAGRPDAGLTRRFKAEARRLRPAPQG